MTTSGLAYRGIKDKGKFGLIKEKTTGRAMTGQDSNYRGLMMVMRCGNGFPAAEHLQIAVCQSMEICRGLVRKRGKRDL